MCIRDREYTYNPVNVDLNTTTLNLNTGAPNLTFRGYKRKNGDVGVRNEIWIIPTVGCGNGIINQLAEGLRRETGGKGVDAIMAYPQMCIRDRLSTGIKGFMLQQTADAT